MKIRFAFLAVMFLLGLGARSTPVLAAPVAVAGLVFEETNSHVAPNAVVELLRARDGQSTPVARTTANGNGRFSFAPQNVAANELLIVRTNWMGYTYVAPAYDPSGELSKQMNAKINPAQVKLSVYQSTTQIIPIDFMTHHLAVESKAGGLKCVERIIVENPTKKTFLGLGARRATVLLNLPAGAKNVKLDEQVTDATLEKRPDGYAVLKPIPPSAYEQRSLIILNYDMDWPSNLPWRRTLDFSRKVQYPTKFFFVARTAQDKRLEIVAPQLSKDQEAPLAINGEMETRTVNAIGRPMGGAPVLKAGDDLKIQISSPVNPLFWGFLAFLILFCLAIPLSLLRRSTPALKGTSKIEEPTVAGSVYPRTLATTSAENQSASGALLTSAATSTLIQRIAKLDEAFENGEVGSSKYSRQRADLKNQALEQLLLKDAAQPTTQEAISQEKVSRNPDSEITDSSNDSGA